MSKMQFPLNEFGYVTKWLVSGPLETPIDPATRTIVNQDEYEHFMKMNSYTDEVKAVPGNITLGAIGLAGMPWRYYQAGENYFVDVSRFYFTMHKCELWAATVLNAEEECSVAADVRDYTAIDVWLNGERVFTEKTCAYSPMRRHEVTLKLHKGENLLFLRMQNSCTRDTRNIAAISFPGKPAVTVSYPGEETETLRELESTSQWLSSITWNGKALTAPSAPPCPISFDNPSLKDVCWTEGTEYPVRHGVKSMLPYAVIGGTKLARKLEMNEWILPPEEIRCDSVQSYRDEMLRKIADTPIPEMVPANSNLFYTVYARLVLGRPFGNEEERVVEAACQDALNNNDCSDFRLCYMLKALLQKLPLSAHAADRIREAALKYSFWKDEPAIGAMCYGSENHSLLFHTSQMMAGQLWPDETFFRSGRKGREQEEIGKERIRAWLGRIEERGFAEFLSGGYTVITVAAMLAAYDFGDAAIREGTGKLLDKIFYDLAANCFDGVVSCPQGRIYRTVLTPWTNSTQALYCYATGSGTPAVTDWMSSLAATNYRIPDDVAERSRMTGMHEYFSAGTKIRTYKSRGFMITSLETPVVGPGAPGPFIPGAKGYQQHLYYVFLGRDCNLFAHHPGGSHDGTQIRPGYWYGNGYFPRVEQFDGTLGAIYRLDRDHPIPFTHLYFPAYAFDDIRRENGWMFGKKGNSYVGVWCSLPLTLHNRDIVQNCDYRAVGDDGSCAYVFCCGDETTDSDFSAFITRAKNDKPDFNRGELLLSFGSHKIDFEGKITE